MTDRTPPVILRSSHAGQRPALATSLILAVCLSLAPPAWTDGEPVELDTLEVTLEIFDNSASLEAFELHLTEIPARGSGTESAQDELAERMARFDDEVAAAAEDLGEREEEELLNRLREEREAKVALEEQLAQRHESDHLNEIARFDSADEMDELDLGAEVDPPLDDVMEDHDGQLGGTLADINDAL